MCNHLHRASSFREERERSCSLCSLRITLINNQDTHLSVSVQWLFVAKASSLSSSRKFSSFCLFSQVLGELECKQEQTHARSTNRRKPPSAVARFAAKESCPHLGVLVLATQRHTSKPTIPICRVFSICLKVVGVVAKERRATRERERRKKKKNRPDRMNTNMSTGEDSYPFKPLSGRRLSNIEQYKQRAAQKRQERIQVGSPSLLSPPSSPPSSFLSSLTDFCGNVQLRFASSCL